MTAFARVTAIHDAIALTLTPCAGQLYRWLLRKVPAGKPQELYLKDFAQWSSGHRKQPYSIRHIQRALEELIATGLIAIVTRYTARIFKLICNHPETANDAFSISDKNVQIQDENVQPLTKMSKTDPSKPYDSVSIYRENRETTKTHHPLLPVLKSDKEGISISTQNLNVENVDPDVAVESESGCEKTRTDSSSNPKPQNVPLSSEEINIDPQLQAEVEEVIAPQPLNMNIKRVVMSASVEIIQNALSVVRQQKKAGRAKRPAGMLVKAIQEHWSPNPIDAVAGIPDGFNEWFNLAREKGIVRPQTTVAAIWGNLV
ncbi:hypothetical protein HRE53_31565 (plasmid) [Acaryochloris sp. 'Moss Beach']|uniref:hypothetical protein n=1 Tax=Acaryochloris sp. 'Moss Beach' TaxID=2740837 RepID=UPI001F371447|nr:hypothetical protein [Acaryochloris sp. 'Moss Beach']UJB73239.1 hypothetical protein HRE53_31565 [Acaryochloris sp. 'Moss Beach']